MGNLAKDRQGPEFRYGDWVLITKGVFRDMMGMVINEAQDGDYFVRVPTGDGQFDNQNIWLPPGALGGIEQPKEERNML